MTGSNRLLFIDDEPGLDAFVRQVAEGLGYAVRSTADPREFMALHRSFGPSIIILDLAIPGTDGIELLQSLAKERSPARIFIMSGFNPAIREAALRLGRARGLDMAGIVPKPVRAAELRSILCGSGPAAAN